MSGKVIDLFPDYKPENTELEQYTSGINKVKEVLLDDMQMFFNNDEDMAEFIVSAWNFANMHHKRPELFAQIREVFRQGELAEDLMDKFVDLKIIKYGHLNKYIYKYEIEQSKNDFRIDIKNVFNEKEYFAHVVKDPDYKDFLSGNIASSLDYMFDNDEGYQDIFFGDDDYDYYDEDEIEYEYEPNPIDRKAIIITYKREFYDWQKSLENHDVLYGEGINDVFLADYFDEDQVWLRKNFGNIFRKILDRCEVDHEFRPKRLTYKRFEKWFDYKFSEFVFDIEKFPVTKETDY